MSMDPALLGGSLCLGDQAVPRLVRCFRHSEWKNRALIPAPFSSASRRHRI